MAGGGAAASGTHTVRIKSESLRCDFCLNSSDFIIQLERERERQLIDSLPPGLPSPPPPPS